MLKPFGQKMLNLPPSEPRLLPWPAAAASAGASAAANASFSTLSVYHRKCRYKTDFGIFISFIWRDMSSSTCFVPGRNVASGKIIISMLDCHNDFRIFRENVFFFLSKIMSVNTFKMANTTVPNEIWRI